MNHYEGEESVNVGVGYDHSIREIAEAIREVVGYRGELRFDQSKPDGMAAKLLESSYLKQMGWKARTTIQEGLRMTYQWFLKHEAAVREGQYVRAIL